MLLAVLDFSLIKCQCTGLHRMCEAYFVTHVIYQMHFQLETVSIADTM